MKTFIEAYFTNNIHWRKCFPKLLLLKAECVFSFQTEQKKLVVYFDLYESSLDFQRREEREEVYWLFTVFCGGHKNNFWL